MPKLPRVTGKDVLSALKRDGLEVIHIKGNFSVVERFPYHSGVSTRGEISSRPYLT